MLWLARVEPVRVPGPSRTVRLVLLYSAAVHVEARCHQFGRPLCVARHPAVSKFVKAPSPRWRSHGTCGQPDPAM